MLNQHTHVPPSPPSPPSAHESTINGLAGKAQGLPLVREDLGSGKGREGRTGAKYLLIFYITFTPLSLFASRTFFFCLLLECNATTHATLNATHLPLLDTDPPYQN